MFLFFIPSIGGRRKAQYRRRKQPYFWYGGIIISRLFGSEKDMQKIVYSCEKLLRFVSFISPSPKSSHLAFIDGKAISIFAQSRR